MKEKDSAKQVVSAQVLLKSHTGKEITGTTIVTSENIADFQPAPGVLESVSKAYEKAGFKVSAAVGNNFAITAPIEVFEREFHATLQMAESGAVTVKTAAPADNLAKAADKHLLPLAKAKKGLVENVQQVTFSAPPDFGPENFQ